MNLYILDIKKKCFYAECQCRGKEKSHHVWTAIFKTKESRGDSLYQIWSRNLKVTYKFHNDLEWQLFRVPLAARDSWWCNNFVSPIKSKKEEIERCFRLYVRIYMASETYFSRNRSALGIICDHALEILAKMYINSKRQTYSTSHTKFFLQASYICIWSYILLLCFSIFCGLYSVILVYRIKRM